jgi:hypothetical protein
VARARGVPGASNAVAPALASRRVSSRGSRGTPVAVLLGMTRTAFFASLVTLTVSVAAPVLGGGCVVHDHDGDDSDSSLTVNNDSSYNIDQLYVTDSGDKHWGPNLLGTEPLDPGDSVILDIVCGTYDVLMVDDTGAQCEVDAISLCFDDATWNIKNNTCNVFAQVPGNASPETTPRAL